MPMKKWILKGIVVLDAVLISLAGALFLPSDVPLENCMRNSDVATNDALPELEDKFETMATLPITGAPVYATITNPDHDIRTCFVHRDTLPDNVAGRYTSRDNTVRLVTVHNTLSVFNHESFHALQDANGGTDLVNEPTLTEEDTAVAMLLREANAKAYEYTAYQEALRFHPEIAALYETPPGGRELATTFNRAFGAAWMDNRNASVDERRELSLQAGGQAVSESLLRGERPYWREFYRNHTQDRLSHISSGSYASGTARDYAETRADVFSRMGQVSDTMNLTPRSLLDPDRAPPVVAQVLQATGITLS